MLLQSIFEMLLCCCVVALLREAFIRKKLISISYFVDAIPEKVDYFL